jgi:hypothetical protein
LRGLVVVDLGGVAEDGLGLLGGLGEGLRGCAI